MSDKQRLELSVRKHFRAIAKRLAKMRRRSISALFEDLVEEEMNRHEERKREEKQQNNPKHRDLSSDGVDGERPRFRAPHEIMVVAAIAGLIAFSGFQIHAKRHYHERFYTRHISKYIA